VKASGYRPTEVDASGYQSTKVKASGYQSTEVKASGHQSTGLKASGQAQVIALAGAAVIGVLAASRGLQRDSIFQVFPLVALAVIPVASDDHVRRLRIVATVTVVGIMLTATHDGGAQWGPRFLLVASVPLMLLAARAAVDALGPGPVRLLRVGLVVMVLVAGAATSRAAYVELRNAKRAYARIVDATAANSVAGGYIVSNVWWLDQVAAPLYGTRTFLYAADDPAARQLTEQVAAGGHPVTLVWSGEERTAPLDVALGGTCAEEMSRRTIAERQLTFVTSRCTADRLRPPAAPR
jgi:hypothetical protein